jgi:hypothetical protein
MRERDGRGIRTNFAVQADSTKDISSAALGIAVESSGTEAASSSGSERSGSDAGSEGED